MLVKCTWLSFHIVYIPTQVKKVKVSEIRYLFDHLCYMELSRGE